MRHLLHLARDVGWWFREFSDRKMRTFHIDATGEAKSSLSWQEGKKQELTAAEKGRDGSPVPPMLPTSDGAAWLPAPAGRAPVYSPSAPLIVSALSDISNI